MSRRDPLHYRIYSRIRISILASLTCQNSVTIRQFDHTHRLYKVSPRLLHYLIRTRDPGHRPIRG
jgi:hypothetical protein